MKRFEIRQLAIDPNFRIPVSFRISEHLEETVERYADLDRTLKKDAIIVYFSCSDIEKITSFYLPPGSNPRINEIVLYTITVPVKAVCTSVDPVMFFTKEVVRCVCEILKRTLKGIKDEVIERIQGAINYEYIKSLPYPAPFPEQKYEGDTDVPFTLPPKITI